MLHKVMDKVFKALADATRRTLLDRLRDQQGQTLTQLISALGMSRQSASRHIAVLENAGLVVTRWSGREKLHYLNPLPIAEIGSRWIDRFSTDKAQALTHLKQALEESENGNS